MNFGPIAYKNDTSYTSHLEALYSAKEPLHYNMVSYNTLQNSPMYKYMRDIISGNTSPIIPVSLYWHAGTTTVLSTLSSSSGWNTKPSIAQGGDGINTLYDLVYGSAISNSFIYNGPSTNLLSGIYGAASNGISLWDNALSLKDQTLANRIINSGLVQTGLYNPSHSILTNIKHGGVDRLLNTPDPAWTTKTISNIPKNTSKVRIFQDRYTGGGGSSPNDNYAIGSIKVTFTGKYKK